MGLQGFMVLMSVLSLLAVALTALEVNSWFLVGYLTVLGIVTVVSLAVIRRDYALLQEVLINFEQMDQEQLISASEKLATARGLELFHLASNERRTLDGFRGTVSEIGYSAGELSSASSSLAANTSQQSQATNSIAAAVTEISHSIEEVSDRMRQTYESANASYHQGEQGLEAIDGVRKHMEEASTSVNETHELLENLEEKTTMVASISGVIRDIAAQTNLLALNAAIEAARAGEHGRGFAVVAEEVRALATRSHNSAEEISQTVDGMQTQMEAVRTGMQEVMERTRMTLDGADGAQEVLQNIAHHTQSVSDMVSAITEASAQQNEAARDISQRVEEMAIAAGESSQVAEQSSSIAAHLYKLCMNSELRND